MSPDSRSKSSGYDPQVPAIDQMMRVLNILSASASIGQSLTEVCRQAGIHKSRGYALLNTLGKYDLVTRDPHTKFYQLGPGLLPLSKKFLDLLDIRQVAQPELDKLSRETASTAMLGHINGDFVFVIAVSQGDHELGINIRIGHRFNLTHGAHGKAILAFMPAEQRHAILNSKPLYFYGPVENTDPARLETEFSNCRRNGYAVDSGELQPGVTAISAPVNGPGGRIIGCVILVGIYSENKVDQYGSRVAEASKKIEWASGGAL